MNVCLGGYMGTQNGVETKDLTLGNFDYVLIQVTAL